MSTSALVPLLAWVALELFLRVREGVAGKGRPGRDRGTRALISISIATAVGLSLASASLGPVLPIGGAARAAGAGVMSLGLAIRVWAVVALGGAFRTTVEVDRGQAVVTAGPYRRVRHPAYTGLLLIVAGFGVALGDWLSVAAAVLVPLPAVLWRIHVEEAELTRVLGDAYRSYQADTVRLVPRLW